VLALMSGSCSNISLDNTDTVVSFTIKVLGLGDVSLVELEFWKEEDSL